MGKTYRNGPVGALMDEYERAAEDLKRVISPIRPQDFVALVDPEAADPDCRSIRTVMNHVVRAGYGYANYIRVEFGDKWVERKDDYGLSSPAAACAALDEMLAYTQETMENKWDLTFDEIIAHQIQSRWKQVYDFEQLMEHAIVHVLRHRRQIERFLQRIKSNSETVASRFGPDTEVTTLYRPVNQAELDLIEASGWSAFPPRLPEQPIFYPVLNEEYARQISEKWNVPAFGVGYVVKFDVEKTYCDRYETQIVGGSIHEELWVPAEAMDEFNDHIVGKIEVISEFRKQGI